MAEDRALLLAGAACVTASVMAWRADQARQRERTLRRDYQALQRRHMACLLADHKRRLDDAKAAIGAQTRSALISLADAALRYEHQARTNS